MNCAKRSYSAQAACALPWAWRLTWTDLCRWRHGWSDVRSTELFGVAQPVASCSEVGGISRRGEVAERRMRALFVVAPLQRLSLGGGSSLLRTALCVDLPVIRELAGKISRFWAFWTARNTN